MRFFFFNILFLFFVSNVSADNPYRHAATDSVQTKSVYISFKGENNLKINQTSSVLTIQVTDKNDNPVSDVEIHFISSGDRKCIVNPNIIDTDSLGYAKTTISSFSDEGFYEIKCKLEGFDYVPESAIYTFNVRAANWVFILIIGLLGGLSLFLYGMNLMSRGLQNSAGDKMRSILEQLTNNRFVAVGIGALITTVIQSSSATNVMLVSFVNSRLMRFKQTIGIILGAAIGTTITVQIIAFKVTDYALVFITAGLIINLISKKQKISEIGKFILGFGILFYGMYTMSESMYPLRSYKPFIDVVISLENPLVGILAGAVFTALIQSSAAFIGILIVLSMQGLLSLDASISLIIGANIGTAITAILASVNTNREAKQVAIAHTLMKIIGAALILLVLPYFTYIIDPNHIYSNATPRKIANAHTLYNIFLFILFIPFTNSITWLVDKLYPVKELPEESYKVKFLDDSLQAAPALALNAARRELIRMMKEVERMCKRIIIPFITHDNKVSKSIKVSEIRINFLRDEITSFLVQLSRGDLAKETVEEAFILMNAVREFEQIADIISGQLLNKAESWCNSDYQFSKSGEEELVRYHEMTLMIIKKAIKIYKDFDLKKAYRLKDKYYLHREEYFELERQHYGRLKKNIEQSVSSSKTHLELMTLFRVISSHATNTARIIIHRKQEKKKLKKK